jgi:elongation factor G
MSDYVIVLRAMTQGRGSYDFNIETYEEVPGNIAQKVIEEAKKNQE